MALTIAIEGIGVIANASSATESIGLGTNQWNENGTGADSWTTDTYLQGGECFAGAYSSKSGFQYYHTATSYSFAASGNAENQYIWIWVNCPTIGLLQTKASKGLAIRVGTSLTAYNDYTIAGSDDANGWLGDWKCFVIDPTKTATATGGGGATLSNINYIGVWIDTAATAKGDNIFIDQIAIGSGLRITGTSTTGWADAVSFCTDYDDKTGTHTGANNASVLTDSTASFTAADVGKTVHNTTDGSKGVVTAQTSTTLTATLSGGTDNDWDTSDAYELSGNAWGMLTEKEGVYFAQGDIIIGDSTMTSNCSFTDSGRIIQFAKSEYWTGSAWAESYPSTACGIYVEDAASYSTVFGDGVIVGTDNGRSGSTIIGNDVWGVNLDLYASSNTSSTTRMYGTTFKDITGTIN